MKMQILFDGITEYLTHGIVRLPEAANTNWMMFREGASPAEALAFAREYRRLLRRENAERMTLLTDPKRRALWEELGGFERCILWWHYEQRG